MNKILLHAVIFDFDGTLVNTEPIYTKSLVITAKKLGVLEDVDFASMAGYQTKDMDRIIRETHYVPDNFFDTAGKTFHEILKTETKVFDGVMETLERLKNLPLAIASNSNVNYVKDIANNMGISKYIKYYSNHNDKLRAKPYPDVFLNAFDLLNSNEQKKINKDNIIIIEDSIAGITAAKKTGIKSFAVTNSFVRNELKEADFIIDRIDEIFNYCEVE